MDQGSKETFLKFKEALALFAGSESSLRRRIADGSIPVRQLGGKGCLIEISYSALMDANQKRMPVIPNSIGTEAEDSNNKQIPGPKPKWRK